ncbi:hypothetical protein KIPB_003970, partial [Kipferlia bialata]
DTFRRVPQVTEDDLCSPLVPGDQEKQTPETRDPAFAMPSHTRAAAARRLGFVREMGSRVHGLHRLWVKRSSEALIRSGGPAALRSFSLPSPALGLRDKALTGPQERLSLVASQAALHYSGSSETLLTAERRRERERERGHGAEGAHHSLPLPGTALTRGEIPPDALVAMLGHPPVSTPKGLSASPFRQYGPYPDAERERERGVSDREGPRVPSHMEYMAVSGSADRDRSDRSGLMTMPGPARGERATSTMQDRERERERERERQRQRDNVTWGLSLTKDRRPLQQTQTQRGRDTGIEGVLGALELTQDMRVPQAQAGSVSYGSDSSRHLVSDYAPKGDRHFRAIGDSPAGHGPSPILDGNVVLVSVPAEVPKRLAALEADIGHMQVRLSRSSDSVSAVSGLVASGLTDQSLSGSLTSMSQQSGSGIVTSRGMTSSAVGDTGRVDRLALSTAEGGDRDSSTKAKKSFSYVMSYTGNAISARSQTGETERERERRRHRDMVDKEGERLLSAGIPATVGIDEAVLGIDQSRDTSLHSHHTHSLDAGADQGSVADELMKIAGKLSTKRVGHTILSGDEASSEHPSMTREDRSRDRGSVPRAGSRGGSATGSRGGSRGASPASLHSPITSMTMTMTMGPSASGSEAPSHTPSPSVHSLITMVDPTPSTLPDTEGAWRGGRSERLSPAVFGASVSPDKASP